MGKRGPIPENNFARSLIDDLAGARFSPRAFAALFFRAGGHSREHLRNRSQLVTSFVRWVILGAAMQGAILFAFSAGGLSLWATLGPVAWYFLTAAWVLLHQSLNRDSDGGVMNKLGIANGLTFLRLALAPMLWVVLPDREMSFLAQIAAASFVGFLVATDLLDGFYARRTRTVTRLGSLMDPLGDMVLLLCLGAVLYRGGILPLSFLALAVLRYPIAFGLGALLFVFRGPFEVRSTLVGKISNTVVSVALAFLTTVYLFPELSPGEVWNDLIAMAAHVPLLVNTIYLTKKGVALI